MARVLRFPLWFLLRIAVEDTACLVEHGRVDVVKGWCGEEVPRDEQSVDFRSLPACFEGFV